MSKVKLQCPSDCRYLEWTNSHPLPEGWYCTKGHLHKLAREGFGAALRRDKGCEYERGEAK